MKNFHELQAIEGIKNFLGSVIGEQFSPGSLRKGSQLGLKAKSDESPIGPLSGFICASFNPSSEIGEQAFM